MSQPQPAPPPYYPPPIQPHTHGKYVGAIIAVGVVALIVGAVVGYGLGSIGNPLGTSSLQQPPLTFTHGTVDIGQSSSQYRPLSIFFDNQNTGTLASPVFKDNTYQLYLVSGKVYQVTIYWEDSAGSTQSCAGRPQPFTPTALDYTQDFVC